MEMITETTFTDTKDHPPTAGELRRFLEQVPDNALIKFDIGPVTILGHTWDSTTIRAEYEVPDPSPKPHPGHANSCLCFNCTSKLPKPVYRNTLKEV